VEQIESEKLIMPRIQVIPFSQLFQLKTCFLFSWF